MSAVCNHCGLPAPVPSPGEVLTFCCNGCRGAYQLIRQWGLDDFYAIARGSTGSAVKAADQNAFAYLDQADLLGQSAPIAVKSETGEALLQTRLQISGLHCAACSWLLERAPKRIAGWLGSRVRMHARTIDITFDPRRVQLSQIATTIQQLGYTVSPLSDQLAHAQASSDESRKLLVDIAVAGFCAANAMWLAIALYAGEFTGMQNDHERLLRFGGVVLGVIAVIVPGRRFFRGATAAIRTRTPHMDLPVSVGLFAGTIGSLYGIADPAAVVYFDSIAALVFFLLVGRWVQLRQQRRAGDRIDDLIQLTPRIANRVLGDGSVSPVTTDGLNVGDIVRVAPGDSFPVDGIVVAGESLVDRSLLTGESKPISIEQGSTVEAGTDNLQAATDIRVTAPARDSRLARLTRSVSEAAASQTPVVQLANRIGGWFVTVVLLLAMVTAVRWWPSGPAIALQHTVSLLIVACPCALALATPLAVAAGAGRLARQRVLVRSGDCLERLGRPGTIFFDKTGTLTAGQMRVTHWSGENQLARFVVAAEAAINHPIATAVERFADENGLAGDASVENVQRIAGAGITCDVPKLGTIGIGNRRLAEQAASEHGLEMTLSADLQQAIERIISQGSTVIFITCNGVVRAVFGIRDTIRDEAADVVLYFQRSGWQVGMLSGDDPATAARVGSELALDPGNVRGGLSPDEKLAAINQAKEAGVVLMVGDGLNDSAALAAADIGIAVRNSANASLAAAPVIMGDGKLSGMIRLIGGAAKTRRVIRQNFLISIGYNVTAVGLAMAGTITPLIAAVLMPISSLTVLFNTVGQLTLQESNP